MYLDCLCSRYSRIPVRVIFTSTLCAYVRHVMLPIESRCDENIFRSVVIEVVHPSDWTIHYLNCLSLLDPVHRRHPLRQLPKELHDHRIQRELSRQHPHHLYIYITSFVIQATVGLWRFTCDSHRLFVVINSINRINFTVQIIFIRSGCTMIRIGVVWIFDVMFV